MGPKIPVEVLLGFYVTSCPKLSHWERHIVVWSEKSKADVTRQFSHLSGEPGFLR